MADSVQDLSPAGRLRDSWRDRWRARWHRTRSAARPGGRPGWALVMGTTRLRLTAYAVASLPGNENGADSSSGSGTRNGTGTGAAGEHGETGLDPGRAALRRQTADLAGFYERLADQVGPPGHQPPAPVAIPAPDGAGYPKGVACAGTTPAYYRPDVLWVGEHLYHLAERGEAIIGPAEKVAEARRMPWWR